MLCMACQVSEGMGGIEELENEQMEEDLSMS